MNKKNSITTGNKNAAQVRSRPTSRRKALKAALAGGAVVTAGSVPTKWVSPVVDSVLLPAHARTSGVVVESWFGLAAAELSDISMHSPEQENRLFASANTSESILGRVIGRIADSLVEPAAAQEGPSASLCVTRVSPGSSTIEVTYQYQIGTYVVNYTGVGLLENQFALEPNCDSIVFGGDDIPGVFGLQPGGGLLYVLKFPSRDRVGVIPRAPCRLGPQNCDGVITVDE